MPDSLQQQAAAAHGNPAASAAAAAYIDPSLISPYAAAPVPLMVAPQLAPRAVPYPALAPTILSGWSRFFSLRLLAQWCIIFASISLAGEGPWRVHVAMTCFAGYAFQAWVEASRPAPPPVPLGIPAPAAPRKSLWVAYVLWLCTGFAGGHHLYLGRDAQACVWAASGGGFLFGWLRDGLRLPEYVAATNALLACVPAAYAKDRLARDAGSKEWIHRRLVIEYCSMTSPAFVRRPPRPSVVAVAGQIIVAAWLGELCASAFELLQPEALPPFPTLAATGGIGAWILACTGRVHLLRVISACLRVVGIALGTTLMGNARAIVHCGFWRIFLAAALAHACALYWALDSSVVLSRLLVCAVAALVFHFNATWSLAARQMIHAAQVSSPMMPGPLVVLSPAELDKPTSSLMPASFPAPEATPCSYWCGRWPRRLLRYTLCTTLLFFLSSSFLLNVGIDEHGTPLRSALRSQFERSPGVSEMLSAASRQWDALQSKGWDRYWSDWIEQLDQEGMESSWRVLGFNAAEIEAAGPEGISLSQLRKRRNTLALRFHPDKQPQGAADAERDPECESAEACEIKFAEVQRAYERIVAHRKEQAEEEEKATKQKQQGRRSKKRD